MPGTIASNLHQGSRSEILADYLFSALGAVTPVRRQDDVGVDLHCTITERIGQRSWVRNYYQVQVKSDTGPWRFESKEEVRWLIEHPLPLFLVCVDKGKASVSVYHTMPRFMIPFWELPNSLSLAPGAVGKGSVVSWTDGLAYGLSAPIVQVTLADLATEARLLEVAQVLKAWIELDEVNGLLRMAGLLRFRMPYEYVTNEIPNREGFVEQGMMRPNDEQRRMAIATLLESLDCVGDQLKVAGDKKAALLACQLLLHLRNRYASDLEMHPRWREGASSPLALSVADELNALSPAGSNPDYQWRTLDAIEKAMQAIPVLAEYIRPATQAAQGGTDSKAS